MFGQIKANHQFRRFFLRGLDRVSIEFGLIAIAHNLMKIWQKISMNMNTGDIFGSERLRRMPIFEN
ncbi:MAG: transposase [Candidatus Marinimicrobia bacterium]|nr:transposase [Candidatus Neomarinimicrobiota bacterium]